MFSDAKVKTLDAWRDGNWDQPYGYVCTADDGSNHFPIYEEAHAVSVSVPKFMDLVSSCLFLTFTCPTMSYRNSSRSWVSFSVFVLCVDIPHSNGCSFSQLYVCFGSSSKFSLSPTWSLLIVCTVVVNPGLDRCGIMFLLRQISMVLSLSLDTWWRPSFPSSRLR